MQPGPKPTRDCGSPPSTPDRKNSHITTSPRQDTPQSWASCHWRWQKERHCTDFPGTENFLVKESNKTHDWGVKTLPMNDSKQHCLHVRYHYQELKISSFIMNKINAFCVSSALSRDSILKTSPEQSAVWFLSFQREHIHFSFKDDLYNSLAVMKIQVFEVRTEVSFSSHPVPCFQATLLT